MIKPFLPVNTYTYLTTKANTGGWLNNLLPTEASIFEASNRSTSSAKERCVKGLVTGARAGAHVASAFAAPALVLAGKMTGNPILWGTGAALVATTLLVGSGCAPLAPLLIPCPPAKQRAVLRFQNSLETHGMIGTAAEWAAGRGKQARAQGRGLAEAAWVGLALGLNVVIWPLRTARAITSVAAAAMGAAAGATVGLCVFSMNECVRPIVASLRARGQAKDTLSA